jgi:hypothetical protein
MTGASHDKLDAEITLTQSDEEVEEAPKQKRKRAPHVLAIYEVIQRWVTGDEATQPEEDIQREIFENAKCLMHLSGLKTLPCHSSGHSAWRGAHALALCSTCLQL